MLNTLKVLNTHVIWTLKRRFPVKSISLQNIHYTYRVFTNASKNENFESQFRFIEIENIAFSLTERYIRMRIREKSEN